MAKITYKELSPEMNRMIAPKTVSSARASIGLEKNVGEFYFIEIERLIPFRNQARKKFNEDELIQLSKSIEEVGIRQPLSIMAIPERPGFYEVISGERRLRAAKLAGLAKVPCLMVKEHDKADEIALIENVHRSDLHPVELGRALKILMIQKNHGGQRELSKTLGLSESSVSELLQMAKLPEEILNEMIERNVKSRDVIRDLLKEKSITAMHTILENVAVVEKKQTFNSESSISENAKTHKTINKTTKSILRISIKENNFVIQSKTIRTMSNIEKEKLVVLLRSLVEDIESGCK
jgi:ParB family chromosome partitioning protein